MAFTEDTGSKRWGRGPFWGLSSYNDPDWVLTEGQRKLRDDLIELCRVKIRPNAIHCDETYTFPRENLNALASLGLLGLLVPTELGGLGESNTCLAMVVETIARYGCSSTAMVFTMHACAVSSLLLRHHENSLITDLLKRLDRDKLVGTLSYSDPATGGHFWYPLSSKTRMEGDHFKILKYGSWSTSAGFADFYVTQSVSPDFERNYSNLSVFLVFKDEVRANPEEWKALGMHGNQSGPLIIEGVFKKDRLVGPIGDGPKNSDESVLPYFFLCTSSCWNGISMACIDIAKKHVTRKAHADVGMRVCDYPTIQDYFGDAVTRTNSGRSFCFFLASALDEATKDNDWSGHVDLEYTPRSRYLNWLLQLKYITALTVNDVSDAMLHACGGSGYKTGLGLERLLRDGKAGWVMSPSNEVARQIIGISALMGAEAVDLWGQKVNEPLMHHELCKLSLAEKKKLSERLATEVRQEESTSPYNHPYQDTDFENPFSTGPPTYTGKAAVTSNGQSHQTALQPERWTALQLSTRSDVTNKMAAFVFKLPNPTDCTGLLPGQYLEIQVTIAGKSHTRFFSPVSRPDDFGRLELVMRFETSGIMSKHFQDLKPGDKVDFRGPVGGFEYSPNTLDHLTLLASGGGMTPGLQIIRSVMANKSDKTNVKLVYYSDTYDEILYREELDGYAASDDRFSVAHTLGEVPEHWEGYEGFIDTYMLERELPPANEKEKNKVVICGGPTMAVSCLHSLRVLGVTPQDVFIYGQFGVEQMKAVYGRNVRLSGHRADGRL